MHYCYGEASRLTSARLVVGRAAAAVGGAGARTLDYSKVKEAVESDHGRTLAVWNLFSQLLQLHLFLGHAQPVPEGPQALDG
jgi:hypothetical protein